MKQRARWAIILAGAAMPMSLGLAGAASAQGNAGAAAKSAPTPPPPPADYAALAKLPDWRGAWQPDWSRLFGGGAKPAFVPAVQKDVDAFNARKAQGENLQGEAANCMPPGMPGIMRMPYPIEFTFTPGRVTLLAETYSQVRRIYTDGRPLPEDPDPAFNGSSVGHWEGDTLVVDTIGLNPVTTLMEAVHPTENTRISERFHLSDPDTLLVETTITDPAIFTTPFAFTQTYIRKRDWTIREYVCEENNRDAADEKGRPSMNIDR